jgi:phage shock protein C
MTRYSRLQRRGLYRSRNGVILGVCRGVADYFDFSVFWIRATVVILFICTGFWPIVGVYILAALLMKSDPVRSSASLSQSKTGGRHRCTGNDGAERLKRKWKHLEKRIRNMEDKVTSREFDWNSRFHGN